MVDILFLFFSFSLQIYFKNEKILGGPVKMDSIYSTVVLEKRNYAEETMTHRNPKIQRFRNIAVTITKKRAKLNPKMKKKKREGVFLFFVCQSRKRFHDEKERIIYDCCENLIKLALLPRSFISSPSQCIHQA